MIRTLFNLSYILSIILSLIFIINKLYYGLCYSLIVLMFLIVLDFFILTHKMIYENKLIG
jgi:hypothetical protein